MKNETDSGRTLVEMLGVLAMAGVLSVMGVMGYRLALDKNKANTLVNQAQQRAVIVMEQMTLNRPLSLQEFSSLNKTPAGTFGQATTQGLTKQFGIQVFGVEKRVCENILNMIGEKTPLRRLSHEASPTVAITQCGLSNDFLMVYNQEMKGAPEDTLYCTDDTDCSSENECMGCEEESKLCQNKCQNLDYLESTGTQYIDTGVEGSSDIEYEVVFHITNNQYDPILGCWKVDDDTTRFDLYNGGNAALIYASFKEQSAIVSKKESKDFNVVFKNWNLLINDTNRKITPTVFTTERNLFLFGNNRGNIVSTSTSGTRINYCKLYDKGALVRDFSPVLAPNGQPALFDQVEKKLYYNKGSGAFLYPDPTN